MYNRYRGNTGYVERVPDSNERPAAAAPLPLSQPQQQRPAPPRPEERRPPSPLSGLSSELGRLLSRLSPLHLETEDLLLFMILYLLWRESGDEEFLFMLAGLLLF